MWLAFWPGVGNVEEDYFDALDFTADLARLQAIGGDAQLTANDVHRQRLVEKLRALELSPVERIDAMPHLHDLQVQADINIATKKLEDYKTLITQLSTGISKSTPAVKRIVDKAKAAQKSSTVQTAAATAAVEAGAAAVSQHAKVRKMVERNSLAVFSLKWEAGGHQQIKHLVNDDTLAEYWKDTGLLIEPLIIGPSDMLNKVLTVPEDRID